MRVVRLGKELFLRLGARAEGYEVGCGAFLRFLGLCHALAFGSLWFQVDGLLGSRGIMPAALWMGAVAEHLGVQRFWRVPTLCWMASSDGVLHALCGVGTGVGLLVAGGLLWRWAFVGLWALYLSLCSVGGVFMGYQWDALLLESSLLAFWVAPRRFQLGLNRWRCAPSWGALIAVWWLLFRLMGMSGAVKWLSHDKLWRELSALTVHYQTQPLPTPLGWWMHQLPPVVHKVSCALMFAIEWGGPLLLMFGRRGRRTAACLFMGLMGVVALSGNYGFFNLLVVGLCLSLLDEAFLLKIRGLWPWQRNAKQEGKKREQESSEGQVEELEEKNGFPCGAFTWACVGLRRVGATVALFLYWGSSSVQTVASLGGWNSLPFWARVPLEWIGPFRSVNTYGLFAVMTSRRPEIVLEGSRDGVSWKEYGFGWKASDPMKGPRFVAPHQPRLDWQMWFGALGKLEGNPWFANLMVRILEGEPRVLRLLAQNPFPEEPPRMLRAALFEYRFTTLEERSRTGAWWERDFQYYYAQPIALRP